MLRVKTSRGDTIIEVLIALMVAALAMGTSYAIAQKALRSSIAARERDQAIGYLESQVNALKLREQADPTNFPSSLFATTPHYCLDEGATGSVHPNSNVGTLDSSHYDPVCVKGNNLYYLDIDTTTTDSSSSPVTKFRLDVRWPRLGGGIDNDATFYYRF